MSSIESNSGVYDTLGLSQSSQSTQGAKKNELGQDAFMQLMIAQLKNQNPLEPMDNGQFLTQMAQFTTASGMGELKDSFNTFASGFNSNQALQASSLVGRQVLVAGDTARLEASGGVEGSASLPVSTMNMQITIRNAGGQVMRTIDMGQQQAGEVNYSWDGLDGNGNRAPVGNYLITAEAAIDGKMQALNTSVVAPVESVTLGQGGRDISLSVAGMGEVPMSSVSKIM
jgi:flagellar basal-body rod modification protein FlgD